MRVLLPCGLEPLSVVGGNEEISEKCEIKREKRWGGRACEKSGQGRVREEIGRMREDMKDEGRGHERMRKEITKVEREREREREKWQNKTFFEQLIASHIYTSSYYTHHKCKRPNNH